MPGSNQTCMAGVISQTEPWGHDTFVSGRGAAQVLRLPSRQHSPPLSEGPAGSQHGDRRPVGGRHWFFQVLFPVFSFPFYQEHSSAVSFFPCFLLPHLMSAAFPWCCWRHSGWQPFAVQLGRVVVSPCETDSEVHQQSQASWACSRKTTGTDWQWWNPAGVAQGQGCAGSRAEDASLRPTAW